MRRGDRCLSRAGGEPRSAGRWTRSRATPRAAASSPASGGALTALTAGGAGREGGQARRGRRLPLLRPHLHDRLLPPPLARRCRGSTPRATRCGRATASRSTTSAGRSTTRGEPVDDDGKMLRDPDGRPLPPAPRTQGLRADRGSGTASSPTLDGSWYRCCGGHVRKLAGLLLATSTSGSTATPRSTGYCYSRPQGLLRHVLPDEGALLSGGSRSRSPPRRCSPGSTGTWSPCGFSMIETIGPAGHTRRPRDDARGLRHVPPGALVGGVLTFGALAALGEPAARRRRPARLRCSPRRSPLVAALAEAARRADRAPDPPPAARALAPGDADAGRRRPLRRPARARLHHLRPHLRRLGAGRDRFAVGDPAIGLAIGLAFGVGRALPDRRCWRPIADRALGRGSRS